MPNQNTGQIGEQLACDYLEKIGYKIIERNIHFSRACELDIIALDKNNTLVAVEVKTRTSEICGNPLEAITKSKYKNIKTGLITYLQNNPKYKTYRIDAISIVLNPKIQIKHLKNI